MGGMLASQVVICSEELCGVGKCGGMGEEGAKCMRVF